MARPLQVECREALNSPVPQAATSLDKVMKRQLHLNLFINSRGHHEASWRHPAASPLPLTDTAIPLTIEPQPI
jgi:hypothetical protein